MDKCLRLTIQIEETKNGKFTYETLVDIKQKFHTDDNTNEIRSILNGAVALVASQTNTDYKIYEINKVLK